METVKKMEKRVAPLVALAGTVCGCCCDQIATRPHVIDRIADCGRYEALNPHFGKAFAFLKRDDLSELKPGRYEIDGDNCWAMVQECDLVPHAERQIEAHRKYIDIQAPISCAETIGLFTMDDEHLALPFDGRKDFVLFNAESRPVTLSPGEFAIFFPPLGAHAPGCRAGAQTSVRKVVIKVKCE